MTVNEQTANDFDRVTDLLDNLADLLSQMSDEKAAERHGEDDADDLAMGAEFLFSASALVDRAWATVARFAE